MRFLLSKLRSPFRPTKPKARPRDGRRAVARGVADEKKAEAKEMARLIAKYLRSEMEAAAPSKKRGGPRRQAMRAARAAARQAARTFSVVSFPKSGRTWLRVMLDHLKLDATYSHDGSDHSVAGHVEEIQPASEAFAGKTIVFLYRDPRDTVVSGFFQATKRIDIYRGSISDFIRDPRHGIEKIARFNLEWLARGPDLGKFMPVTYEELQVDTAGTLARIVAFTGAERLDEAIRTAVDEASFEKMQQKEAAGELAKHYGKALIPRDCADPQSFKVREGIVGGFRKHLTEADIAFCGEVLTRLGYPLDRHGSREA